MAAFLGDLGKTASQISNSRLGDYLAIWARIVNKTSLSKVEGCSDKARRINHNKAVSSARVRNKAGDSSVDWAKITNKINNSKAEDYLVVWASKIKHSRVGLCSAARIRIISSSSSNNKLVACLVDRHKVLLGNLHNNSFLSWGKVQMHYGNPSMLSTLVSIMRIA